MTARGDAGATREAGEARRPVLRVVRGRADAVDVAALTAVLTARLQAPGPTRAPAPVAVWDSPAHRLGVTAPGPDAWRTSGWGRR
ncbi:acyl-CoA carboxylase subunit epsilon [Pseudokineococcus sp. 1T1Z-3]|uniref:acyl-CoA carboxylase subunit epsilon n=1 Tax=Pseudokineococcus sp. 1T1Z-3 TaxID=3132745 RepID=UPI0030B5CBAD